MGTVKYFINSEVNFNASGVILIYVIGALSRIAELDWWQDVMKSRFNDVFSAFSGRITDSDKNLAGFMDIRSR